MLHAAPIPWRYAQNNKDVVSYNRISHYTRSHMEHLTEEVGIETVPSHPQRDVGMNFDDYQMAAEKTAIYPEDKAIEYLVLGLTSEAGEVAGKLKKFIRDYEGRIGVHEKNVLAAEIGDVLWYVAMLALELDVPLSKLATDNINKLESRKARGVLGGSGDNR